jgi:hypothetical protein
LVRARDAQSATGANEKKPQIPPNNRDFRTFFITAAQRAP